MTVLDLRHLSGDAEIGRREMLEGNDLELAILRQRHELVNDALEFLAGRVGWSQDRDAFPMARAHVVHECVRLIFGRTAGGERIAADRG